MNMATKNDDADVLIRLKETDVTEILTDQIILLGGRVHYSQYKERTLYNFAGLMVINAQLFSISKQHVIGKARILLYACKDRKIPCPELH